MSQQHLDDSNVHASLQHVRGEAVPERNTVRKLVGLLPKPFRKLS
jgi:hypothetical protein